MLTMVTAKEGEGGVGGESILYTPVEGRTEHTHDALSAALS